MFFARQEVNQAYEVVKEVDCLEVSKEGNDAWESAVKRYSLKKLMEYCASDFNSHFYVMVRSDL